jgi:hypothetical protein
MAHDCLEWADNVAEDSASVPRKESGDTLCFKTTACTIKLKKGLSFERYLT